MKGEEERADKGKREGRMGAGTCADFESVPAYVPNKKTSVLFPIVMPAT